jgi:hypothetical protein
MAIKRWNASTSQWELVGTPGTATPAAIGAAALVGGNTFTSTQRINGRLAIQSTGDRQVDLIGQDGNTYAYIGTTGGIGSAPANSLKIRSDAGGIIFGYQGFEQARIDPNSNFAVSTTQVLNRINVGGNLGVYFSPSSYPNMRGIVEHSGQSAGLRIISQGSSLGGDVSGALSFWTSSANSANTSTDATIVERMRIDSAGNIGIGTGAPANFGGTNLQITHSTNFASILVNSGTRTIQILASDVNGVTAIGSRTNHHLGITTNDTERMRIGSTGNVTIGATNTGSHKLYIEDAQLIDTTRMWNTNASFGQHVMQTMATRANTSAYYFYSAYSSGGGDAEFWVRGDGQVASDSSYTSNGADYAEYFEWADGNPNNEDRVGYSVSLINDKIKIAEEGEVVFGIVSGNPSVVGDGAPMKWTGKYLKNDFGSYIRNEDGERILNPEYDEDAEYISREARPEWSTIGLMGKLRLRKGQAVGANWIKMKDISEQVEEWLVR